MKLPNWIQNIIASLQTGAPTVIANGGKPIEQVTIKYKEYYLFIDFDGESGEPTGGFGWAEDPTMNPTMPVRDIWTAQPPQVEKGQHS